MGKVSVFDDSTQREIKSIDNVFGNFLVNKGLYDEIEITKDNIYELVDLVEGHVKINVYCPECRDSRVFSCEGIPYYKENYASQEITKHSLGKELESWQREQELKNIRYKDSPESSWKWNYNFLERETRLMTFKFSCAMDNTHHLDYIVLTSGNMMKKIGQYPSVADLSFPELKEYRKVMTKEDEKELKRAIGLFASGIGIGSFVYLRRIFERIIVIASQKAIEDGRINKENFDKLHVDEKIRMLADYLPQLLVNNKVFYGIISKGIHELCEEECLEYFPVMQSFIMMILRQWEKDRKDKEEENELIASLNTIAEKLK